MGRVGPRPLRVCVHDHAGRAGTANRDKGLAGRRPIGVARSARGRVIAGVLFTCSLSDSGRDRDVRARGEHGRYVMASWRAPRASYLLTSLAPYSNVVYVDFAPSSSRAPSLSPLRSHTANGGLASSLLRIFSSFAVRVRRELSLSLSFYVLSSFISSSLSLFLILYCERNNPRPKNRESIYFFLTL